MTTPDQRQPAEGGRDEVDAGLEHQDHEDESDDERAERLAAETAEENPDRTTRREAVEQTLAAEGLSDEGEELGPV